MVEATRRAQRAPLDLLKAAGAIDSPYQFHWRRFLFETFPKGTAFPPLDAPAIKETLPLAPVQAFSIDDSATTEIDDALSVQGLGSGTVVFGVHIAAPGLAITPDSRARQGGARAPVHGLHAGLEADHAARRGGAGLHADRRPGLRRRSAFTSRFDEATLDVKGSETKLERVRIVGNLRHDQLDSVITEATLDGRGAGRLRTCAPNWPSPSAWRGT